MSPKPRLIGMAIIPYLNDPPRKYHLKVWEPPSYDPYTQVFTYTQPGKDSIHIHIGDVWERLYRSIQYGKGELVKVTLTSHMINHLRHFSGVEVKHLSRITKKQYGQPGLMLDWGETQTIIDGAHRAVLRFLEQEDHMMFYRVTPEYCAKSFLELPQDFGLDPEQRGWKERDEVGDYVRSDDGIQRKADGTPR